MSQDTKQTDHPKVFISYSWDSEEHKEWVLKLATDLRQHGVDVVFDRWDTRLGDDLTSFMEQGLTNSCLVLCICSDTYVEKTNVAQGGVGYEKRIISKKILTDFNMQHIIPIIRNNPQKVVPTFLSTLKYADFSEDANYSSLYWDLLTRIYGKDITNKPHLGSSPFESSALLSDRIEQSIRIQDVTFSNTAFEGRNKFDYKQNSGKFSIGCGDFTFVISFSECGRDSIYCYRDYVRRIGYNPKYTDFPLSKELINFDYTSRCKSVKIGEILILENENRNFAVIKINAVNLADADIGHLVDFSYKIYQPHEYQ